MVRTEYRTLGVLVLLVRLFFAQPGGASGALSEFDSRLAELSDILGSSMRSANHAAPNGSCAQPEEDGSANCKNQTSPNLLILPEIEMERYLRPLVQQVVSELHSCIKFRSFKNNGLSMVAGNTTIEKPREEWSEDERRLVQYNLKAKNIITFALGIDEYFRVSNCKSVKDMWDTLQVTHEGTTNVKRSRINTSTHEYELFRMKTNESIQDMQKRFTHIVNHLASLGRTFQNEDLINKVLRCLSREWQPKVTTITESRDLSIMSLATLFGKLQEHEMELQRLNQHEENDKKKKGVALKASSSIQEESDIEDSINLDEDEDLILFVKRFNKFIRMRGNQRRQNFKPKRRTEKSSQIPKCFECNQPGHLRADCPIFKRKMHLLNYIVNQLN
ncbi:hypothetical protein D0Y65_004113 [Glycine soja]|uniref:CCHC-type domain-containing protein n=1 Tax=Glycine soja TaxID=3848 RepID=A0A445LQ04_GLYSO|nr:hypothetical protein D0Y65_004113 [Glycine soja]